MTGGSRTNKLRQNARRAHLANGDRAPRRANQPAPAGPAPHLDMPRMAGVVLGPDLNRSESAVKPSPREATRSGERVARAQRGRGEGRLLGTQETSCVRSSADLLAPHPPRRFAARHPLPACGRLRGAREPLRLGPTVSDIQRAGWARLSQRGWVEPAHGQHGDIVGRKRRPDEAADCLADRLYDRGRARAGGARA